MSLGELLSREDSGLAYAGGSEIAKSRSTRP